MKDIYLRENQLKKKIKHYCDLEIEHLKEEKKKMIEDKRLSKTLLKIILNGVKKMAEKRNGTKKQKNNCLKPNNNSQ